MPVANLARISAVAGGDQQQIGLLGDRDMFYRVIEVGFLAGFWKQVGDDLFSGQSGEGERADKLARRAGHHNLGLVVAFGKEANQLGGLVGGDAAADADDDFRTLGRGGGHGRFYGPARPG